MPTILAFYILTKASGTTQKSMGVKRKRQANLKDISENSTRLTEHKIPLHSKQQSSMNTGYKQPTELYDQ